VSDLQLFALCGPAEKAVSAIPASHAALTLGHVLTGMGADYEPAVRLEDIHVIRHTFKPGDPKRCVGRMI
jgi:hypothetical protein